MKTRIYVVAVLAGDGDIFLVEAPNKASARNHVARKFVSARFATQHDLIAYLADGVVVEKATVEDEPPL